MDNFETRETRRHRKTYGNVLAGLLLLVVGGVLLLRQTDYPLPAWLFKWPMVVITAGLFIGAANRFRDLGWLFIVGVGAFFLTGYIWPEVDLGNFILPAIIIVVGLIMIFRPRVTKGNWNKGDLKPFIQVTTNANQGSEKNTAAANKEDKLDVAAVFGSVKKTLFSKNFKGGEIVSVFGGVEIDLSQADFQDKIVIESVQIFGGATLIVPSTWQIRSEAVAIFGGIEDKRKHVSENPEKVVILEGFAMFGGIEIKSY